MEYLYSENYIKLMKEIEKDVNGAYILSWSRKIIIVNTIFIKIGKMILHLIKIIKHLKKSNSSQVKGTKPVASHCLISILNYNVTRNKSDTDA